jgi:hypothetical protein
LGDANLEAARTMWKVTDKFRVRIGGNTYINVGTLVAYKGDSLLTLKRSDEDGVLGVFFDIYDKNGKRVAAVRRNEIYVGNKDDYEVDGSATQWTLRNKHDGAVICDIRRESGSEDELTVAVKLYTPSGFLFDATPDATNLPGRNKFIGNTIRNVKVAFPIE